MNGLATGSNSSRASGMIFMDVRPAGVFLVLIFLIGIVLGVLVGYYYIISSEQKAVSVNGNSCYIEPVIIPGDKYKIVDQIDSAQESIYMEMYTLTDEDVIGSLISAKERGVDVKVILDNGQEYNKDAYITLGGSGVSVEWSDPQFKITHSKLMIIDNETVVLGSPNFTHSGLNVYREVGLITNCTVEPYLDVFFQDWKE